MKQTVEIVEDEEVLQTTTCTPKDIDKDPEGWKVAFRDELDSFKRLDVMDSVPLNTLDTSALDILPCKVVMVKKPQGDGTHRKKGRVVVCGNFQQVQPGEETCGPSSVAYCPVGGWGRTEMDAVPETTVPNPWHLF